jgi:hypothetical protein
VIDGARKILGIDDPDTAIVKPVGALSSSCAAVYYFGFFYYLNIPHVLSRLSEH